MSGSAEFLTPETPLDDKVKATFGDLVVKKALAKQASFARLPRYVSEYLIAKYVKPESWQADIDKIKTQLSKLIPSVDQREQIKNQLLRDGTATVIDLLDVRVDLKNQLRLGTLTCIEDRGVRVSQATTDTHGGLLAGGMWGTIRLRYEPHVDEKRPISVESFTAFQVGLPELDHYTEQRRQFTTAEWIDLVLTSVGYAPSAFPSRRKKLLLLSRLVPLVERNVNLLELGPRQTGKTFLLRNVSPHVFTVSGAKATPASLFVNLSTGSIGILGARKIVVFDEIAHTRFDEASTVSMLKDFMESGQFARGKKSYASEASVVLAGNLDVDGERPHDKYKHLFEPLPEALEDTAFLDRIHMFLPGWEVPKITPATISTGYGFVVDYFGEVLTDLRRLDFRDRCKQLNLSASMTQRDLVAIEKVSSGLIKILYPHGEPTEPELREVVSLAAEMRQRVHDQLVVMAPGEFSEREIGLA